MMPMPQPTILLFNSAIAGVKNKNDQSEMRIIWVDLNSNLQEENFVIEVFLTLIFL